MTTLTGILFSDPQVKPLSTVGQPQAGAYLLFYLTGTTTPANVYADGALTTPLSQVPATTQPSCTADSAGRFNPIYLNPSIIYRVQLYTAAGSKLEDTDPYLVPGTTVAGDIRAYGAVSGSDCTAAVSAAAAANKLVVFPQGVWPINSNPTIPSGVVLATLPGSSFSGTGAVTYGLNTVASYQFNVVEGDTVTGPAFRDVMRIGHTFGGAAMQGGRNSFEVQSSLTVASSPSNTNRNYVAGAFQFNGIANDNGTSPAAAGTAAGAGFGLGAVCILASGATSWLNASAAEFNISVQAGASVFYRSGIQIAELIGSSVQGTGYDVMVSLSNQGGVGWQNGILFSAANGAHPITTTGTLMATNGAKTVAKGIDLTSYTFSATSFAANGFSVNGNGLGLDLGIGSSLHQTQHHTSGATYDTRIVSQSGTGSTGAGDLLLNSGKLGFFAAAAGGAKAVGYGTPTGNAYQASFAAGAITLPNLAAAVAQLIIDLKSYTLIGA